MKRTLAVLLMICLVAAGALSALAEETWDCPACGHTGNTGDYCTECGAAKDETGSGELAAGLPDLSGIDVSGISLPSLGGSTETAAEASPSSGLPDLSGIDVSGISLPSGGSSSTSSGLPDLSGIDVSGISLPSGGSSSTSSGLPDISGIDVSGISLPSGGSSGLPDVSGIDVNSIRISTSLPTVPNASATLAGSVSRAGGITTIRWSSTGSISQFKVTLQAVNGSATQKVWNVGTTSGSSITTFQMMPGRQYKVILYGDGKQMDSRIYICPDAAIFEDGRLKASSVKVGIEPRRLLTGETKPRRSGLNASKIIAGIQNGNEQYGFKYQMRMPTLAYDRSFYVQVFMEAPNGYLDVLRWGDVTFDRVSGGYQTLWWEFIGNDFFEDMLKTTGDIPSGRYKLIMFWDGMLVNTSNLDVGR